MRIGRLGVGAVLLAATQAAPQAAAQTPTPSELSAVTVIAATPLESGFDRSTAPAPVQTATASDIERSHAPDLTAFLNRSLGGVYINDVQNNPLQPDLNYRGYTASPLLGAPQGLSVYVDGVRFNQPFGDVVSWDLIPRAAIARVTLEPGSNPLFGLNTLGGALSIRTKDGRAAPGSSLQLAYGSYDRWQAELETGGRAANGLNWYVTANRFQDEGWREASPSRASQAFGKLGWSDARTDLALSLALADTDLAGNGLQEERLLARDRASVYTRPDVTRNRSGLVNLTAAQRLTGRVRLSGNAYWRRIDTRTLNGDVNDESLTEALYQPSAAERAALAAAGFTGVPVAGESAANTPFPSWRCIANVLLDAEPNEKCDGLLNRSRTEQDQAGVAGQITVAARLGGRANELVLGAGWQGSRARFVQSTQFGYLTPDREVAPVAGRGAFADGSQASESAFDARVDLTGRTAVWSAYAADTVELAPAVRLSLSGRWDSTRVENRDALTPAGPGSLSGDHGFSRFNPAVGLTVSPRHSLTLYASWGESSRAPSAVELGCSDPAAPCRLPNAMAGDPPLRQVVTRTAEAGARGRAFGRLNWRAGAFRAENYDDILFVAAGTSGYGYFRNFGRTRRQGVELGADAVLGPVTLAASYAYLEATYRSAERVGGAGNSANDIGPGFEGAIAIRPGDRIPLVPDQVFKASLGWAASPRLRFDADLMAVGGAYARGDENNRHQPDGVFYLGPGRTGGYAVVNLGGEYRPSRRVKLFLQVTNLLDQRYETAAQLGPTGFTDTGAFIARPFAGPVVEGERPVRSATFYGPGAPRLLWGGVKLAF